MLRKNVAGQFIHFQGVDAATGGIKSGVTWTARRCIDGTFAAATGTATEDGATGWYKFALSQADTNGNNLGFNFTGTGAVPQTVNVVTTAADPTDSVRLGLTALPNAAAAAAGGLWILGANAAATTTLTGIAAAGATPATPALSLTGGAASTTGGGVAAQAMLATGGAGAASTNGAAEGVKFVGGGTNTVASNAHGFNITGTSTGSGLGATSGAGATGNGITATAASTNGSGATLTKTGSGSDFNASSTPLVLAKTTNITGFNDITAAAAATGVWQDSTAGDFTVANSVGKTLYIADKVPGAAGGLIISGSNSGTTTLGALTVTGTMTVSDGISVTRSTGNSSAITAAGSGTGSGFVATSGNGVTGDGIQATSIATNGNGLALTKNGSGNALAAPTTNIVLAKTTNITGLNDIAATAVVSAGAITTNAGAVSTVTNTTQLNGAVTVVLTDASSDAVIADAVWNGATASYGIANSYGALVETNLDAVVSAVKTQTDKLTFTVANQIDANVQYVNDVLITGNGQVGTEWGP